MKQHGESWKADAPRRCGISWTWDRYRPWASWERGFLERGTLRSAKTLRRSANVLRQVEEDRFVGEGVGFTTSRFGDPSYEVRAGQVVFQDLQHPEDATSFADLSPELSREFRGLRLWLPLKLFGVAAFRDNLREKLELARWAYEELAADPGFECLEEPQLSIVAFRLRPDGRADVDAANRGLLQRVNAYRRVYLSSTTLRGQFVLRICVLSFRTHARQVETAIEDIRRAARAEGGRGEGTA